MLVATAIERMIAFYKGDLHDVSHFLKVWALAKTIGEQERLEEPVQLTLELAAVVHDIACPLCREKYGDVHGHHQELESPPLVQAFLTELPVSAPMAERITWLVAHHHTYAPVDGLDHRILLEADFLVNAGESGYSPTAIDNARQRVFRTAVGLRLLDTLYRGGAAGT